MQQKNISLKAENIISELDNFKHPSVCLTEFPERAEGQNILPTSSSPLFFSIVFASETPPTLLQIPKSTDAQVSYKMA